MLEWEHLLLVALSVIALSVIFIVLFRRCSCLRRGKGVVDVTTTTRTETLQDGIAKLHQGSLHRQLELDGKRRGNYYVFRRGVSARPLFNWADHPSLITDAVENGWSRFGFTGYMSSPSTRSSLLGFCAVGDNGNEGETEISWEVCQGSADFMQKIRLNSGLKKINVSNPSTFAASVIRTALPLPGPPLGNSAFPQEAYFEITVLYSHGDDHDESITKSKEGEKIKLIQENSNPKLNSESLAHVSSSRGFNKIEELKIAGKDDDKSEAVMLSLGLTTGGSLPLKHPGSYPGSIGFNSNGSVYLEGTKLVFESEKGEWARRDKVIGCGFDPRQKKVFFTVDAELVHVIHCKSEEFGTPLYPTIAANNDIIVLVNFGQSSFSYALANAQRTPNPCFIGPLVNSSALGYEDSKELFSMGRIDSQWLNRSGTRGTHNGNGANNNNNRAVEFDEESEADLFEIVLDGSATGRSPNTVAYH
ncbi:uncharacterized protein LOC110614819 [Manihot esculenta]|uniref:B30.2/SPRY domain-containing protein n=1 Tax=Manihot esculenta TaxID=3983 RepID=A0A2C9VX73_MANES|nr:uncharacterized protein LOC110614819 [Manihot esculenta]OAY50962.1 hypothetical protein MANES_05G176200v8 [Manihot esculenta]